MIRLGAGPIPSTVIVPGGISVCPASFTKLVIIPADFACPIKIRSDSSSFTDKQTFLAPPLVQRSNILASLFLACSEHDTAACEHCTASLPADNLRSFRTTNAMEGPA